MYHQTDRAEGRKQFEKKKKGKNWKEAEVEMLLKEVKKWSMVVFNKSIPDYEKKSIWDMIANKVTTVCGNLRTGPQCKEKNTKMKTAMGAFSRGSKMYNDLGSQQQVDEQSDDESHNSDGSNEWQTNRPAAPVVKKNRAQTKQNHPIACGDDESSSCASQGHHVNSHSAEKEARPKPSQPAARTQDRVYDLTEDLTILPSDSPKTTEIKVATAIERMDQMDEEMRQDGFLEDHPASPIIRTKRSARKSHQDAGDDEAGMTSSPKSPKKDFFQIDKAALIAECKREALESFLVFFRGIQTLAGDVADDLQRQRDAKVL